MPAFVTRKMGVELARERLGIPLTLSAVEKSAHAGNGPEPDAMYGRALLYTPDNFLTWASGLIRETEASRAADATAPAPRRSVPPSDRLAAA